MLHCVSSSHEYECVVLLLSNIPPLVRPHDLARAALYLGLGAGIPGTGTRLIGGVYMYVTTSSTHMHHFDVLSQQEDKMKVSVIKQHL